MSKTYVGSNDPQYDELLRQNHALSTRVSFLEKMLGDVREELLSACVWNGRDWVSVASQIKGQPTNAPAHCKLLEAQSEADQPTRERERE